MRALSEQPIISAHSPWQAPQRACMTYYVVEAANFLRRTPEIGVLFYNLCDHRESHRAIALLDSFVCQQRRRTALVHHLALIDDDGAVGETQRPLNVLLD